MIWDALTQFAQSFYYQLVNITLDDPLSYLYVILNALLLLYATLTSS